MGAVDGLAPKVRARDACKPARPALGEPVILDQDTGRRTAGGRLQKYFARRPFSPALSSIASASRALELRVLGLQLLQTAKHRPPHAAVAALPLVQRRRRDACLRHRSVTLAPTSYSCRTPTICRSLKRDFRIGMPPPSREERRGYISNSQMVQFSARVKTI